MVFINKPWGMRDERRWYLERTKNHIITMSSIRNIYFEKPIVNRMTQGSIINGCVADSFPNEEVYGLIITPRCDVCHEGKVDSVHYLPVVPFERWFEIIAKPKITQIGGIAYPSKRRNTTWRRRFRKGMFSRSWTAAWQR